MTVKAVEARIGRTKSLSLLCGVSATALIASLGNVSATDFPGGFESPPGVIPGVHDTIFITYDANYDSLTIAGGTTGDSYVGVFGEYGAWIGGGEGEGLINNALIQANGLNGEAAYGIWDQSPGIPLIINNGNGSLYSGIDAESSGYIAYAAGIEQDLEPFFPLSEGSGDLVAEVQNNWWVTADADAYGEEWVDAAAHGVRQELDGEGEVASADASVANSADGVIWGNAEADAQSDGYYNDAWAYAGASGVSQGVDGVDYGSASVDNSGGLIQGTANAGATNDVDNSSDDDATALAFAFGVDQAVEADYSASLSVVTGSRIFADATSDAVVDGGETYEPYAFSHAAAAGVSQFGLAYYGEANASVVNRDGEIVGEAMALASNRVYDVYGGYATASAWGEAAGVVQNVLGESASAFVANGESFGDWHAPGETALIRAEAFADANASDEGEFAYGEVNVAGILQYVDAGGVVTQAPLGNALFGPVPGEYFDALAEVVNYGDVEAYGQARATANPDYPYVASGEGYVNGIQQEVYGYTAGAGVFNEGAVSGEAVVNAYGEDGAGVWAHGEAGAVVQYAGGYDQAMLSVVNSGDMFADSQVSSQLIAGGYGARSLSQAAGVSQFGEADSTDAMVFNREGEIAARSDARSVAMGGGYFGPIEADSEAAGVWQDIEGYWAWATVVNGEAGGHPGEGHGGEAVISAMATAFADQDEGDYYVNGEASAVGVAQWIGAYYGFGEVANNGTIEAFGEAMASTWDATSVYAAGEARGVSQYVHTDYISELWVDNGLGNRIDATAESDAWSFGNASSSAYAAALEQDAESYGEANVRADNFGAINGEADARADSGAYGWGSAVAYGTRQYAGAEYQASAVLNNGWFDFHGEGGPGEAMSGEDLFGGLIQMAEISANADTRVYADLPGDEQEGYGEAFATAVSQGVETDGFGEAIVNNFAGIYSDAFSYVEGTDDSDSDAEAFSLAYGVEQYVGAGESGIARVINTSDESIEVDSTAIANASDAFGEAVAVGIMQEVDDGWHTLAEVYNSGSVDAWANGEAEAGTDSWDGGEASAYALGIAQEADGWTYESAYGPNTADTFVGNIGTISASANASSYGSLDGELEPTAAGDAYAMAQSVGIWQDVEDAEYGDASVENFWHGSISSDATAYAKAEYAYAAADAYGIAQAFSEVDDADATLYNGENATITVTAGATADDDAFAIANARGYAVYAFDYDEGVGELWLDIENEGLIDAMASANGVDQAVAEAQGIDIHVVDGSYSGTMMGVATDTGDTPLYGELVNSESGAIFARAVGEADGETGSVDVEAIGIHMDASLNETTTVNQGLIFAQASGFADYGDLWSTGILLTGKEEITGAEFGDPHATIINDGGTIFSAVTWLDDGEGEAVSFRGVAIDTEDAPNPVLIEWQGNERDGYIAGHVLLSEDDAIEVSHGTTVLDGNVNYLGEVGSEAPPILGEGQELTLDESQLGDLSIVDDGNLVLARPGWWDDATWPVPGPDQWDPGIGTESWWSDANAPLVLVDTLHVGETGTLTLQLGNDDSFNAYGHIYANEITLDEGSTLFLEFEPALYDDSLTFTKIIDAPGFYVGDPNNTFTNILDNSALLATTPDYILGNDSLTVALSRNAFGDVDGLSGNSSALGDAIENVYPDVSGLPVDDPFRQLVENLFTLDETEYPLFLMQMSGAEYAQALQSTLWSTRAAQDIITERMSCSQTGLGSNYTPANGDADRCFVPGEGQIWVRGFASSNENDGDANAPGYSEDPRGVMIGGDYAFDTRWYAGVAGGFYSADMSFDPFGGPAGASIDYSGGQVAIYGGYDTGAWYARGVATGGFYNGSSTRLVMPDASVATLSGDFSSSTVSVQGEVGKRMDMAGGTFTPFVGLNIATARLGSFTETESGPGAPSGMDLAITGTSATSVATRVGARFMTEMEVGSGVLIPEVAVAWEHEFADPATVDMSLASAPPGADFAVSASDNANDSLLLDVGGRFVINKSWEAGVAYKGRISSGYSSHGVTGRIGKKF